MPHKKQNPKVPCRAAKGSGTSISSPAINPENSTPALAINRLRARFGLSEPVAALVAHLAGLGPQAVRS